MREKFEIEVEGRVQIFDHETRELLRDTKNAVHPQNMAMMIAKAISRDTATSPGILQLCFGNGGTFFNSSNQIVFRPPNTVGVSALYNQTYSVQVDDQVTGTPSTNSVIYSASPSPAITSIVTVTAQLNANEPAGQAVTDNVTTNPNSLFTFDEIGLKAADGSLLTHLVFSPFEKTANRAFLIIYTLTISVS
jgi:hypothetical protein